MAEADRHAQLHERAKAEASKLKSEALQYEKELAAAEAQASLLDADEYQEYVKMRDEVRSKRLQQQQQQQQQPPQPSCSQMRMHQPQPTRPVQAVDTGSVPEFTSLPPTPSVTPPPSQATHQYAPQQHKAKEAKPDSKNDRMNEQLKHNEV